MITRAQAEALLSLAEALEACERQELELCADRHGAVVYYGNASGPEPRITSVQVRRILSRLVPKSIGS